MPPNQRPAQYLYHSLQIASSYFVSYPVFELFNYKRNSSSFCVFSGLKQKQSYKGEINAKSKSKIVKAVNLLYDISTRQYFFNKYTGKRNYFRINFITLTLSAAQMELDDKIIKKECFEWWLSLARRKFGLKHYVWKAERQKNGNLHFHLTTNCFIDVDDLRDSWNLAQNRIGFLDLFELKHNHTNPNSTDIKIVNSKKAIGSYIAKYIGKELEKGDRISGKVWDCSKSLKSVKLPTIEFLEDVQEEIKFYLDKDRMGIIEKDYITIFTLKNFKTNGFKKGIISTKWQDYLQEVRTYKTDSIKIKKPMGDRMSTEKKSNSNGATQVKQEVKKNKRLPTLKQIEMFTQGGKFCKRKYIS